MIFFITSSILTYQYVLYIIFTLVQQKTKKKIEEQYTNNDKQEQNPRCKHYIEETKILFGFVSFSKIKITAHTLHILFHVQRTSYIRVEWNWKNTTTKIWIQFKSFKSALLHGLNYKSQFHKSICQIIYESYFFFKWTSITFLSVCNTL